MYIYEYEHLQYINSMRIHVYTHTNRCAHAYSKIENKGLHSWKQQIKIYVDE